MPRKAAGEAPTDCLNRLGTPGSWASRTTKRYRAFADPRASGQLLGFQTGIDLWRHGCRAIAMRRAFMSDAIHIPGAIESVRLIKTHLQT
jgi:hypothetical protein